jgi:hypothetical protein
VAYDPRIIDILIGVAAEFDANAAMSGQVIPPNGATKPEADLFGPPILH